MATKMHVSNNGGSQKRKRGERTFKFETFCDPGEPTNFSGSFHENVRALLDCGHMKATAKQGEAKCSSFKLELQSHPPSFVRLFIAEEAVGRSQYRQCQYCRSVGWSHHMICNERFHFVLPSKDASLNGSDGLSIQVIYNGQSRNKAIPSRSNLGHSMHAVVHSNGYGHLLYINGFEGGSDLLSGHQIVDFWDRICTALHVRKISLTDVAKKGTMELRLIHGVAYGEPWFGRWGFKYGHGSYGVTQQMHQQSLDQLQAAPLSLLASHFACTYGSSDIPMLIAKYQALGGHKLLTLGNLLRFMMELKSRLPINSLTGAAADYHDGTASGPAAACRWSTKRVETAAHVIVEALKKFQMRWVTRQEVREAARAYVGDTGLLDYVLKSLGNHIVGNYIVRRSVNPVTKVLEYSLEDASNVCPNFHAKFMVRFQLTRVQLMRDLLHLYRIILKDHQRSAGSLITGTGSVLDIIPLAVRNILDTKHLVKDYRERSISLQMMNHQARNNNETIQLFCNVLLRCNRTKEIKIIRKELPPVFEIIRVHPRATVSELKKEVEKHFREIYWGLRSFVAESIVDVTCKDSDIVSELIKPGTRVVIQGRADHQDANNNNNNNNITGELFEGEIDEVVFCLCGAKDEDGERMICCDICEVWQHTRCVGIPNDEEVPQVFLCNRCENDIVALPAIQF